MEQERFEEIRNLVRYTSSSMLHVNNLRTQKFFVPWNGDLPQIGSQRRVGFQMQGRKHVVHSLMHLHGHATKIVSADSSAEGV